MCHVAWVESKSPARFGDDARRLRASATPAPPEKVAWWARHMLMCRVDAKIGEPTLWLHRRPLANPYGTLPLGCASTKSSFTTFAPVQLPFRPWATLSDHAPLAAELLT